MILDLGRISKALAGGITGGIGGAGAAATWLATQPSAADIPWWGYTAASCLGFLAGFALGFIPVYLAPANTEAPTIIPAATIQPPPKVVVVEHGEPVPVPKADEIVAMIPPAAVAVTIDKSGDEVVATMPEPAAALKKEKTP